MLIIKTIMATPLTDRNLALCVGCQDCLSVHRGPGCKLIRRLNGRVFFKRAGIKQKEYWHEIYKHEYHQELKAKRNTSFEKLKMKARRAVKKALILGELIQPNKCQICGTKCIPDAHHPDYNKFLKILWLCKSCHKQIHGQKRVT